MLSGMSDAPLSQHQNNLTSAHCQFLERILKPRIVKYMVARKRERDLKLSYL